MLQFGSRLIVATVLLLGGYAFTAVTGYRCTLNMLAYSAPPDAGDGPCFDPREGFLRLDGKFDWKAGWCTTSPNLRGVNTFIVDPETCTAKDIRQFDTWANVESATDLAAYLHWIRDGAIIVGITGDEPTNNLGPAQRALRTAGVWIQDVQYRGNFAFILQRGYPEKTRFAKALTDSGTQAVINVAISGTTLENLQFV